MAILKTRKMVKMNILQFYRSLYKLIFCCRYRGQNETKSQQYTTKPGLAFSMEKQCQLIFSKTNIRLFFSFLQLYFIITYSLYGQYYVTRTSSMAVQYTGHVMQTETCDNDTFIMFSCMERGV